MLNIRVKSGSTTYDFINSLNIYPMNYDIGSPEAKTYTVEVPYRNSVLDMTNLFGRTVYKDRTLRFNLLIMDEDYLSAYNTLNHLFNGKVCQLYIGSDNSHYYEGRITIGELKSNRMRFTTSLQMTAYPYRYKNTITSVTASASYSGKRVTLSNEMMPVCPTFLSSGSLQVTCGGKTYVLQANEQTKFREFIMGEGNTDVILTGAGEVTISYREGIL